MVSGSQIEKDFTVTTASEWLAHQDREWIEAEEAEYELVAKILGLHISHYILRRTSHVCQSVSDNLYELLGEKTKEYEEKFGKPFVDLNVNVPY